jgi:hypothetical protein
MVIKIAAVPDYRLEDHMGYVAFITVPGGAEIRYIIVRSHMNANLCLRAIRCWW